MSQKKYNKEQKNPLNGKWEKTGVAVITAEDAERLSTKSLRYVLAPEKAEKKTTTKPKAPEKAEN